MLDCVSTSFAPGATAPNNADNTEQDRIIRPELCFFIPREDQHFFATRIPLKEQRAVRNLLSVMRTIHKASSVAQGCRYVAGLMNLNGSSLARGYSEESLKRKYYAFLRAGGNWRALVDRAKAPQERVGLPKAFIELVWKKFCDRNQRKNRPAYRELIEMWRTRFDPITHAEVKKIDGYSEWPAADPMTGVPKGWTESNLSRHTPDKFERVAARNGRAAASALRLPVLTSRVGLRLMEYVQFDDHEFNLKVNFPGQTRAMRPRGFTAVDVLSSCFFASSFKPTLWDEDEEKKRVLTERDMMWFVVKCLTGTGYRKDDRGTVLCVEWGTAAIREAFAQRIFDATCGQVRVERSGKFGRPSHAGQFEESTKGNFRFKALIESYFNLLDNCMASLPGQVGKDRNDSPGELHGREKYNATLLKVEAALPELAGRLKHPFLTYLEFLNFALDAVGLINGQHQHKLEGWERAGFATVDWRLNEGSEWMPQSRLLELPEAERTVATALCQNNPALIRHRKLSRQEAFNRHSDELQKVSAAMLPTLMGPENALNGGEPVPVRSGLLSFQDQDISPDPLHFEARNEEGRLPEEEKYLCFVNPFEPTALVACDARLRVVAVCPAYLVPCRNDVEGVTRLMGKARHWESEALAKVGVRNLDQARAMAAMREHNGNVISGRELKNESAFQKEQRALEDLADEALMKNFKQKPTTED